MRPPHRRHAPRVRLRDAVLHGRRASRAPTRLPARQRRGRPARAACAALRAPERPPRRRAGRRRLDGGAVRPHGARRPHLRARELGHEGRSRRRHLRGRGDPAGRRDARGDGRGQRHRRRGERRFRRRRVARPAGGAVVRPGGLRDHPGAVRRRSHLGRPPRRLLVRDHHRGPDRARQHAVLRRQRGGRDGHGADRHPARARPDPLCSPHRDAGGAGRGPLRDAQRQRHPGRAGGRGGADPLRAGPVRSGARPPLPAGGAARRGPRRESPTGWHTPWTGGPGSGTRCAI